MATTLIYNIATLGGIDRKGRLRLQGSEMAQFETLNNAYLLVKDGRIADFGPMDSLPELAQDVEKVDAEGGMVMPSFCDSHTHIVNAGSREGEFVDKINGLSYAEIAKRGGGILNSADKLHGMSEDELFEQSMKRVREDAGNLLHRNAQIAPINADQMVLVLKAHLVLVGGAEAAAVVSLQLDLTMDGTAVDVHVEHRHKDDDLVARLAHEVVHAYGRNLRDRAVRRRENVIHILHDFARGTAEEICKVAREHDKWNRRVRMCKGSENNSQNKRRADKLIALAYNDHAHPPPYQTITLPQL